MIFEIQIDEVIRHFCEWARHSAVQRPLEVGFCATRFAIGPNGGTILEVQNHDSIDEEKLVLDRRWSRGDRRDPDCAVACGRIRGVTGRLVALWSLRPRAYRGRSDLLISTRQVVEWSDATVLIVLRARSNRLGSPSVG